MSRKSLVPIVLPADPTQPLKAATKQYVDASGGGGGGDHADADHADAFSPLGHTHTAAIELIGSVSLAAPAATIDFSSIPATFTHLQLVAFLRGDANTAATVGLCRLNGDSAANYNTERLRGDGATATAVFGSAATGFTFNVSAATSFASMFTPVTFWFPAYRVTAGRQFALWQHGWGIIAGSGAPVSGDLKVDQGFGYRQQTAIINRITLAPTNGNFVAGSVASLYGLM